MTKRQLLDTGAYMRWEAGWTDVQALERSKEIIVSMDANKDGMVSFQEFLNFQKDVLYQMSDEEFERVRIRFQRMAHAAQKNQAPADQWEVHDWHLFGSQNSSTQREQRLRSNAARGTTPPRRSGEEVLLGIEAAPSDGQVALGPRRTGVVHEASTRDVSGRVWLNSPSAPTSSREARSGFGESYSTFRHTPDTFWGPRIRQESRALRAPPQYQVPQWARPPQTPQIPLHDPIGDMEHHLRNCQ